MTKPNIIIIDSVDKRRSDIHRILRGNFNTLPVEKIEDIGKIWPENAWILQNDDRKISRKFEEAASIASSFMPRIFYSDAIVLDDVVSGLLGGAIDYILWPFSSQKVEQIMMKSQWLVGERSRQFIAGAGALNKLRKLTSREMEVLRGMRFGHTNKKIAIDLSISPRTVEIHRAHAIAKLEVGNTANAISLLIEAERGLHVRPQAHPQ